MALMSRLNLFFAWLGAALFVATGFMLAWEVAARYFFVSPTIWAAELSQLCLIWGTLMAMPWALERRRHIAVDALVTLLPVKARAVLDGAVMLLTAAFSAMVAWKGSEIFWDSFARGRGSGTMLGLPAWIPELAVPFGFSLLVIQALVEAARSFSGRDPESGGEHV
jgi:TRAP-type C4-dicarboxylate transport system permease small subunit